MIQRTTRLAGLLGSVLFATMAHAQTPLDTYLTQLKTLRAGFSQVVTDSKGREVQKAHGTLVIVRPGRFRWELTPDGAAKDSAPLAHGR
jgi:outer membrane lipoprotein carrier protein